MAMHALKTTNLSFLVHGDQALSKKNKIFKFTTPRYIELLNISQQSSHSPDIWQPTYHTFAWF